MGSPESAGKRGISANFLDFLIELRSRTARLKLLQNKMQEYLASGLRLGWLINRKDKQVEIHR